MDNLDIAFEQGKITGIIGPNGSGKTTLTNLLTGIHKPESGQVIIDGIKLYKLYKPYELYNYRITRTFQEVRLFEQMTALDNVLVVITEKNVFGALFSGHSRLDLKKAEDVLEKVGLWEKRGDLAINLSYGQRKLLEIARVLAVDAKIIFFDEPFAGLFKEMTKKVAGIMEVMRSQDKTLVLIEHNMELIRELCDYLYVMDEGKLLTHGDPKHVLSEKKVIEAYLGE